MSIVDRERPAASGLIPVRWLWPARLTFIAVALLTVLLFAGGLPEYYRQLNSLCPTAACPNSPTAGEVALLHAAGISIETVARYFIALDLYMLLVNGAVAVLIFWRRSADRMAWFTALALLTFGAFGVHDITKLGAVAAQFAAGWWLLLQGLMIFGSISFTLFFYVFPDGRFAPSWLRWVAVVWGTLQVLGSLLPGSIFDSVGWPVALNLLYWFSLLGLCVYAQLYHYHRVSTYQQRQQTKWVVLGVALAVTGALASYSLLMLAPLVNPGWAVLALFSDSIYYLFLPLVPLSIGFAMFRSGLYDVDVVINRALVYGLLTALLAGIYAGLVIGLQALFTRFTGQTSDVALIGSTLAIVALFQPLRRGVAAFIDRRFYRRRYDGQQVLAAFAGVLRDRPYTDPDDLRQVLLNVVEETIQPAHVTLRLVDAAGQPPARAKPGG